MRPWILQLGPLVIPTEAREEMHNMTAFRTTDEFLEAAWKARDESQPYTAYPACFVHESSDGWPFKYSDGDTSWGPKVSRIKPLAQSPE